MQPTATITNITAFDIDTVIVWDDGERFVAYAYKGGRVIRTTPLVGQAVSEQVDEIRGAFRITDGQVHAFADTRPTVAPPAPTMAAVTSIGPRRWS